MFMISWEMARKFFEDKSFVKLLKKHGFKVKQAKSGLYNIYTKDKKPLASIAYVLNQPKEEIQETDEYIKLNRLFKLWWDMNVADKSLNIN